MRFIYRPIRVSHLAGDSFEIFNTTAFSEGENFELKFDWNDGTSHILIPQVAPLNRVQVKLPLGKEQNGCLSAIVSVTDRRSGKLVSEEQLIISRLIPNAAASAPLPEGCTVENGCFSWKLPNGKVLRSAEQGTLLYRAATDNDTDMMFNNTMKPYYAQTEKLLSQEKTEYGWQTVTQISNKKGKYTVTDTWEGTPEGVLVTSRLHCVSGSGFLPRFGKVFQLDESFDEVQYTGRTGETYCDMKEQFPIGTVSCHVADMTEPNIRPQESGNRCDCTEATISDGETAVSFVAVGKVFELGVKPYTDKALVQMKHREDEKRTATYVTIQAFQQGIGTGACGPGIMPEFLYSAKHDYELKFLIRVK